MSANVRPGEHFTVDKMHAAHRQMNAAIRLHFEDGDPLVVLTLSGAASILFTDMVVHRALDRSWDARAQQVMKLDPKTYFGTIRAGQNFLKHADSDPNATLDWWKADTEAMIMMAVMNASELDHLSTAASVFQLWYIGKNRDIWSDGFEPLRVAEQVFPRLSKMSEADQREAGLRVLDQEYEFGRARPNDDRFSWVAR